MSLIDPNDFEDKLATTELSDDESLPELLRHFTVVSDALEKCEKILKHLAVGNYSFEFKKYMSLHIQLTSRKNQIYERIKTVQKSASPIDQLLPKPLSTAWQGLSHKFIILLLIFSILIVGLILFSISQLP